MRHANFLVLTGRLSEFPLHELIETLRGQRKSGRLQVEFKAGPAALYFREGALVDARMGDLRNLEALSLALSLEDEGDAAFNFNPLVAPPEAAPGGAGAPAGPTPDAFAREAARSRARVIEVEPEYAPAPADAVLDLPAEELPRPRALPPAADEGALFAKLERIEDAVVAQARRANFERAAYAVVITLLLLSALVWRGRGGGAPEPNQPNPPAPAGASDGGQTPSARQGEADTGAASGPPAEAAANIGARPAADAGAERPVGGGGLRPAPERRVAARTTPAAQGARVAAGQGAEGARPDGARAEGGVVQVRMTVERGRVLRAEVSNPRPGMASYEALALRMARQRRFPEEFSGQETLRLKVGQ